MIAYLVADYHRVRPIVGGSGGPPLDNGWSAPRWSTTMPARDRSAVRRRTLEPPMSAELATLFAAAPSAPPEATT